MMTDIYMLIKHQSSPHKYIAFRLIRYAMATMQRHLEAEHNKLPLMFYTDNEPL